MYCFSYYSRAVDPHIKDAYLNKQVRSVNVESVKKLFLGQVKGNAKHIYEDFIKKRTPLHWGGLSDPFCPFEKEHRIGLELLKFFDSIDYPIIFSTKGSVMLEPEYFEIFKRKPQNYFFQIN